MASVITTRQKKALKTSEDDNRTARSVSFPMVFDNHECIPHTIQQCSKKILRNHDENDTPINPIMDLHPLQQSSMHVLSLFQVFSLQK
mmetsp:Transcript_4969/g.6274  ORF Transcript_4969/g.6274 Transcript_4969/m.6274 type:complete len:88 (-) Transcript_4969:283-546(-)